MPHKHKRRKENNTASLYDLPPTSKARPLTVGKHAKKPIPPPKKKQLQRKDAAKSTLATSTSTKATNVIGEAAKKPVAAAELPLSGKVPVEAKLQYGKDDTPRAFARLLSYHKTGRGVGNGLDDGNGTRNGKKSKKRKRDDGTAEANNTTSSIPTTTNNSSAIATATGPKPSDQPVLKIQPGEKLSDFGIRVDQTLSLSGISSKGKKVAGVTEKRTKHDKRLQKLQSGWRSDEAKIREKEEEAREIAEEEWEEKLAGMDRETREVLLAVEAASGGGTKKGKKRRKQIGEVDSENEDPWAVLESRREKPRGVFEVNVAPPTFSRIPKELFKERTSKAVDVPRDAGSLRRREELGETRQEIIGRYRAMMAQKRSTTSL